MMTEEEAREIFLEIVTNRVFIGNSEYFDQMDKNPIPKMPVGHFSYEMFKQAKELYDSLDEKGKNQLKKVYELAVYRSSVELMSIFDNISAFPVSGKYSSFSLRLEIFEDEDSLYAFKNPQESFLINESGAELMTLIMFKIGDYIKSREEGQQK